MLINLKIYSCIEKTAYLILQRKKMRNARTLLIVRFTHVMFILSFDRQSRVLPKESRSHRQIMEQGPNLFTILGEISRLPLFFVTCYQIYDLI